MSTEGEKPLPTVQLRHKLPDGSEHIDWMIAQDAAGETPLLTWRLPGRVDELMPGESLPALRIGDHRPQYLEYEGPLSGDRGSVTREAWGRIVGSTPGIPPCTAGQTIVAEWCADRSFLTQTLSLTRISSENWTVTCTRRDE